MYAFGLCISWINSRVSDFLFPIPWSLFLYTPSCAPVDLEIRGRVAFVSAGNARSPVAKYGRLRVEPVEISEDGFASVFPYFDHNI